MFGPPVDHQWRKFVWSGQYWVVHWGNALCSFDDSHFYWCHIHGLLQDCSNSSALALELLQSCTKPLKNPSNGKGLGSPSGPSRGIFRSPSQSLGCLGQPDDFVFCTLQETQNSSPVREIWGVYGTRYGMSIVDWSFPHTDSLVQDCNNSIANTLELL